MNTKEKIIEALEDEKEFELVWTDEVTYSTIIKARIEEEAREIFNRGDIDFDENDVTNAEYCEDSVEVNEIE